MDADEGSEGAESGDHSPPQAGSPVRERSMDGPFFVTAVLITLAFVVIVFFLKG